ncbi:Gfo/Idh/MocA family oxidoreductase [Flagellimonas myxillae]|uniref:Gfo/Idh/MocA family oxidoreductase n=1 Tax=Flagellimonas myxillae TaxID=2942214 RepID=UPI00201F3050|nr:Gfo/Idh/MocA family oxidoreductase [Muricauda myxillae]MCL6265984.1 Gfo/Idh/MocA family oxidoreductase [Muricauda myxillae]
MKNNQTRRKFLAAVSMLAAGTMMEASPISFAFLGRKLKIALIGTGIRGITFWGKRLVEEYSDTLEFVGLCDPNPGRLDFAKGYMGVTCNTYSDFDKMVTDNRPDLVIVTTTDSTHHEYIIRGLELGCDILTEKPMTTDEVKCQQILDAERKHNNKVIVGFNYRWMPYNTKIKQLLMEETIGQVTSVDFNWYLNTYHGASYFRRWHGLRQTGGTLWVHKATHHFDLLNWWLNSDPMEVFAYGDLEHYGSSNSFRGNNCRDCQHTKSCDYHWDITKSKMNMDLYVNNEKHDGYIRDNCLFRKEINIYDKMSSQIKYANGTVVNYSLTTYSPFEGWRIAFNGTKGRIEAWYDIPYRKTDQLSQEELHALEMEQNLKEVEEFKPLIVHHLWEDHKTIQVPMERGGHGGGDKRLHEKIFKLPDTQDPFDRAAGVRDGAMSILIGIGARKSIESGHPVKIAELTDLEPRQKRL